MHFAVQTIVLPISRKAIQPEATIVGQPILAAAGFQLAAAGKIARPTANAECKGLSAEMRAHRPKYRR